MGFVLESNQSFYNRNGNSAIFSPSVIFKNTRIDFRGSNCSIEVGDNVDLMKTKISLVGNSKLIIGDNCLLRGEIWVGGGATVTIGRDTRVTDNVWISAVAGQSISVGEDCLIAANVKMRTHDGHPIYDTISKELLNPNQSIKIENHVWLADDVLVLKGSTIGNGSVIGARSLVSGSLPAKALCVGIPCRVIKENVTWEHNERSYTSYLYSD